MSDIIKFDPQAPGEAERFVLRLHRLPRHTRYQDLCRRLAAVALDLPIPAWRNKESHGKLLRQCDDFFAEGVVHDWIIEAASIDPLAGMVILDAMEYISDCLGFLALDDGHELCESGFKRDFTQIIQDTPFVFRIPAGWELSFRGKQFDEGNYGVGGILRCHLSQSSTHENWAWGDLVGRGQADYTDVGYFGVPCKIVPQFKRMPIDVGDERWGMPAVTGTIPFQWMTHTVKHDESDSTYRLEPVPDEAGILAVGNRAILAVAKRQEEIAQRRRDQSRQLD